MHEFITFSARNPQLHRIIMQESKADGPRMDYLVDRHVRPIYKRTIEIFESLAQLGVVPNIPAPHLYYILTGAGPTMSYSQRNPDDSAPSIHFTTMSSKRTPTRSASSCSVAPETSGSPKRRFSAQLKGRPSWIGPRLHFAFAFGGGGRI